MTKEWFVEQIEQLQGRLYRVALCMLRNDADVQDALQETVLKAWEKRHTLRNEAYFGTWVTRIAINTCKQMYRQNQRMVMTPVWVLSYLTTEGQQQGFECWAVFDAIDGTLLDAIFI